MKNITLISLYLCLNMILLADDRIETQLEIFLYNDTDNVLDVYNLAVSIMWNENDSLTSIYQRDTVTIAANYIPLHPDSYGVDTEYGYNYIYSGPAEPSGWDEIDWADLGYGKYKIWVEPSDVNADSCFYIDLRDVNMSYPIDIDLFWDGTKFKWRHALDGGCGTPVWQYILNNQNMQIWNMWGSCAEWKLGPPSSPNTEPFQPTTPTNLELAIVSTHPKLTWDASQPASAKYNIWRQYALNPWTEIASNLTVTNYTDYTATYTPRGDRYYYKVRAKSGDGSKLSPAYSNTVQTTGFQSKDLADSLQNIDYPVPSTLILSSYPNPFNPVTTIQYQLPERSYVLITIYDLLGREVTTLVSETQDAGFKSVQWDASNMASGVYLYQIRAGKFVQTRKMVVLE